MPVGRDGAKLFWPWPDAPGDLPFSPPHCHIAEPIERSFRLIVLLSCASGDAAAKASPPCVELFLELGAEVRSWPQFHALPPWPEPSPPFPKSAANDVPACADDSGDAASTCAEGLACVGAVCASQANTISGR